MEMELKFEDGVTYLRFSDDDVVAGVDLNVLGLEQLIWSLMQIHKGPLAAWQDEAMERLESLGRT